MEALIAEAALNIPGSSETITLRIQQTAAAMNRKNPLPRFDVTTLKALAGQKVFERGVAYDKDKRVDIVSVTAGRVVAQVQGSEPYRTELVGADSNFSGKCSCMAYRDFGFCKHMVAMALRANALTPDAVSRVQNRAGKIKEHLKAQGTEALAAMILGIAERDEKLMRELEFMVAVTDGDDKVLFAQCKRAIDEVIGALDDYDYRGVGDWADTLDAEVSKIAVLAGNGRAELALRLLEHLFEELDDALGNLDDSKGEGGGVYARACGVHLSACRAAKPEPLALAQYLFERETESDWEYFLDASFTYEEILGAKGMAEYRRLATEAWQKLKPKRPRSGGIIDADTGHRFTLTRMMEGFALRDGDVDSVIAIRTKDLSSAYNYLGLAQLCVKHGRNAAALDWVSEGLWQFEDNPDSRLTLFAIDLYLKHDRRDEAEKIGWQMFEKRPDMEVYKRLKAIKDPNPCDAVRDRAVALLKSKLTKKAGLNYWEHRPELLLDILIDEGQISEAWAVAKSHGCSPPKLKKLAAASENAEPREALAAYVKMIEELVNSGGNANYDEAFDMIKRTKSIQRNLGHEAEHAAFVAALSARHKAKRNFMKLLQSGA